MLKEIKEVKIKATYVMAISDDVHEVRIKSWKQTIYVLSEDLEGLTGDV